MPSKTIPAPVGGWNARDALDAMPEVDAVRMVNVIPRGSYCESRRGSTRLATGLPGSVETVVGFHSKSSSKFNNKILASAGGNVYNVTSGTPVLIKGGFGGLTPDRWQTTYHSEKLILTNASSIPQVYDGTTMVDLVATGPTLNQLWGCNTFKGRVFYWEKGQQRFWYAAAGSFQGTLTQFDLSGQLTKGGFLMMMLNWTLDAGDGVDDLAVFVFSTGEVLVYAGDDPGNANAWALQGRFAIGSPIDIRGHAKVGNTEILVTLDGYVDIGSALRDARYSEKSIYSEKVNPEVQKVISDNATNFGWAVVHHPADQLFIVNVPTSTLGAGGEAISSQHVRNTASGGWCEFSGLNAKSMCVFNDVFYYGTSDGKVFQALKGGGAAEDNTVVGFDVGIPIEANVIQAFNPLGTHATQKQVTAMCAVTNYAQPSFLAQEILSDFDTTQRATLTAGPFVAGTVDLSVIPPPTKGWRNASGAGEALAVSVRWKTRQQLVRWYSTHLTYKQIGPI